MLQVENRTKMKASRPRNGARRYGQSGGDRRPEREADPNLGGGARIGAALLATFAIGTQAACSEQPKSRAPTEQEIHSLDSETKSRIRGRHLYACDDGKPMFVDFKDTGLQLELRQEEGGVPEILSAPSQGLQYEGKAQSATMTGSEIRLVDAEGRTRVCTKQ